MIDSDITDLYIACEMKIARCFLVVLMLLVFGGGTVLAAVHSGDMIQRTADSPVDQSMPGSCNDCDGSDMATTKTACSAPGTCMQAVDSPATSLILRPGSVIFAAITEHIKDFEGSLEPFPPKA